MRVYTIGRNDIAPLYLNLLRPPRGTAVAIWRKQIVQAIAHGYFLGEGSIYVLNEVLKQLLETQTTKKDLVPLNQSGSAIQVKK